MEPAGIDLATSRTEKAQRINSQAPLRHRFQRRLINGMNSTKRRGDRAELEVATELIRRGYRVAFPFGEDADYDLIVDRGARLERVQIKYACSDGVTVVVRCRSVSLTQGKVRSTKRYTAATIEWLAVFDATTEECFFIPAWELGEGRNTLTLRLAPAANNQRVGVHSADRYRGLEQTSGAPRTP